MFLNTSSFKIRLCRISLPWIMLYLFKTIQCTSTANTSVVLYRRQRLRIQFHTPIEFSNSTDKCCIIPFFSVLLIQSYFTKCLLLIFYQARMERLFFWCQCVNQMKCERVVWWYRGWLERESRHGLQPGQNWFLISSQWWQQWKDYVRYVSVKKKPKKYIIAFTHQWCCVHRLKYSCDWNDHAQ